jgi:cyclohexanone monooxygenase
MTGTNKGTGELLESVMTTDNADASVATKNREDLTTLDYDAIVIGAGFAGLALIHYLRKLDLNVRVFDRASDVGGTWAWNHYPGAATDSESYYYCLTFSPELLQEWSWTKRYPGREETQSYMRFVADKCDMWPYIQLNTEIVDAQYMEERGYWQVTTGDGSIFTCKYFISGMGMISEPMIPKIAGMDKFKGPIFHSSRWPTEGLDYAGKKVDFVIGSDAGGGYDVYARNIGKHLGRFLPGNPNVVPRNMPGAGSGTAAASLYRLSPKDGTVIGALFPGVIVGPLLEDRAQNLFDPNKFEYLATADSGTRVCITGPLSKVKTFEDLLQQELIIPGTGVGAEPTVRVRSGPPSGIGRGR